MQATFGNWLRDRHQNEIMLVNLSSINYLGSRPQYIHYSRKSIDPAGRERRPHHTHNAWSNRDAGEQAAAAAERGRAERRRCHHIT